MKRKMVIWGMLLAMACGGCAGKTDMTQSAGAETQANVEADASGKETAQEMTPGEAQQEAQATNPEMEMKPQADPRAQAEADQQAETKVVLGDEQFDVYLPLLEGKRVALFSNHTGIVGDQTSFSETDREQQENADLIPFGYDGEGKEITYGQHILDALIERGVNVTAIFSPEHGFRGTADAGASIDDSVDAETGVPILSLYHEDTHYPSKENMDTFDVLVVDMQDVGLRYYT